MPLFRFTDPPAHLADATFLFDENPDPERYSEVTETPEPKSKPKPETTPAESAPTEDPEGA